MNLDIIIPVLTALIGALVVLHVRRKNILDTNIKEFTNVFVEFIRFLETKHEWITTANIKESIKQHKIAAIILRNSLPWLKRFIFKIYWWKYRKKADKYYNAPIQISFPSGKKEMLKIVETLIRRVKRL